MESPPHENSKKKWRRRPSRPPLTGPRVPQPDLLQLSAIDGVSFQKPLADVFPLRAACLRVSIERLEEGGEAGRSHVGLAYRYAAGGSTGTGVSDYPPGSRRNLCFSLEFWRPHKHDSPWGRHFFLANRNRWPYRCSRGRFYPVTAWMSRLVQEGKKRSKSDVIMTMVPGIKNT